MTGYIILGLLMLALAFILFSPWLKGWRTLIFSYVAGIVGSVLPLATQIVGSLQELDWRTYVLAGDRKNLTLLAIFGGFAVISVILRYMTSTPVGGKD